MTAKARLRTIVDVFLGTLKTVSWQTQESNRKQLPVDRQLGMLFREYHRVPLLDVV